MKEKYVHTDRVKLVEHKIAVQTLKDCHSFLQKKLGVETNLAIVKRKPPKRTQNLLGLYNHKSNTVLLNLYTLQGSTIEKAIDTLAHEMRHAVQCKNKWLSKFKESVDGSVKGYWKGKEYNNDYYNSPWEMDARKYGEKYTKIAADSLNLKRKLKIKI
jgi:hypothetical protein